MADPFRLRVLKALTTLLEGINPENQFTEDLSPGENGPRVFRGKDVFGENDPLPVVTILEHPRADDPVVASSDPSAVSKWELLIQGFVDDGDDHPTDKANVLVAEVIKQLVTARQQGFQSDDYLGLGGKEPCVTDIEIGQPVCRPADGRTSSVAFFYLPVTLTLVEDRQDPFASNRNSR